MRQNTSLQCYLLSALLAAGAFIVTSFREVEAVSTFSKKASDDFYFNLRRMGIDDVQANILATIHDPPAVNVTEFTLALQYDPLKYTFRQSSSGPLGVFWVGGDAPPPNPGIGTMPIQELPGTGFNAGAPLPGSTLTYTDIGGVVTMTYQLSSPITIAQPANFFRLDFEFITPVTFRLSESSVTYDADNPGVDFTQTNFSCVTTDASNSCGSEHPAAGVTLNLVPTPEPSSIILFVLTMFLGTCLPRRRK